MNSNRSSTRNLSVTNASKWMLHLQRMLLVTACVLMSGCMNQNPMRRADYRPVMPLVTMKPGAQHGSLYNASTSLQYFSDVKARRVGDIITVVLREKTDASKSADTNTDKASTIEFPNPTIFGRDITLGGYPLFQNSLESSTAFEGQGDSSQSNSLTGNISVTVTAVYPNGNMLVRGEKVLTLNQGSEVVRISGLVRPVDVTPENTIFSTQIADAQITYSGSGMVADSNQAGWMTRFFNSPYWPF
jgi:flagellar L-ring protein precursor FlgH